MSVTHLLVNPQHLAHSHPLVTASLFSGTALARHAVLFLLIMVESAGIPLPGETALIAAAALAGRGSLSIPVVIGIAGLAAIIGDNIGYALARKYGPELLRRPGPFLAQRKRVIEHGEPFFDGHGAKAVFLGRWISGLRTWAAWLAGASGMGRTSFALCNAAGAITWATTIGLIGYLIGRSTAGVFTIFGGIGVSATMIAAGVLVARGRRRRTPARQPAP